MQSETSLKKEKGKKKKVTNSAAVHNISLLHLLHRRGFSFVNGTGHWVANEFATKS